MSADDDHAGAVRVGTVAPLRGFQRPALWLGLWIFGWLLCVVLSLIHAPGLATDVPEGDKIEHLLAYGLLSVWAVWLFAGRRAQLVAALGLVGLGIAMEFAQGYLTTYRSMDWRDALADTIGVAVALQLGRRWPHALQRLDTRFFKS